MLNDISKLPLSEFAGSIIKPLRPGERLNIGWTYAGFDDAACGFVFLHNATKSRAMIVFNELPGKRHGQAAGRQFETSLVLRPEGCSAKEERLLVGFMDRLASLADPAAFERFLFMKNLQLMAPEGTVADKIILRLSTKCNQNCVFCNTNDEARHQMRSPERTYFAIEYLGHKRIRHLCFSGGEPTLDPKLIDYCSLAAKSGFKEMSIQTNAIRLADIEYARELAGAGLSEVFVSLHSHRADISDAITRAPDTFEKTLSGIGIALELGIVVTISHVLCEMNYKYFDQFIGFVWDRYKGKTIPPITVSFVAPAHMAWRNSSIIPSMSSVVPFLRKGIRLAEKKHMHVIVPSVCGIPICMMEGIEKFCGTCYLKEAIPHPGKSKTPRCAGCSYFNECDGVWDRYVQLHGDDELSPVSANKRKLIEQ